MNRNDNLLLACTFLLSLIWYSCTTSDEIEQANREIELQVSINNTVSNKTRVILDGDKFEANDEFKIFFNKTEPTTGGSTDGVISQYKYESNNWVVSGGFNPIYWDDKKKDDAETYFCVVMPAGAMPTSENESGKDYKIVSNSHSFTVQTGQKDLDKYKKSDLMIARNSTKTRLVAITFNHVLSRLIVKFEDPDAEYNFTNITYDALTLPGIKTTGNINYDDETGIPEVTADENITDDVVMYYESINKEFMAILPPQTIANGTLLLTMAITTDGTKKTYNYKVNVEDGSIILEQGKFTTLTLKLAKTGLEVSSVTIEDWKSRPTDDDPNPIVLPDD